MCNMDYDARCKRGAYIEKTTDIREMFKFARPAEKLSAISVYANTLYGYALWDLHGERAEAAFRCHRTAIKLSWDVPRTTHRWIVSNLLNCGLASAREQHMAMYAGFFGRLRTSVVREVRMMATFCLSDMRTTTAKNIFRICDEFKLTIHSISPQSVKEAYQPHTVLPDDQWKLEVLREMLEERQKLREDGRDREGEETLNFYISVLCEL
jgi:hypothetical protein